MNDDASSGEYVVRVNYQADAVRRLWQEAAQRELNASVGQAPPQHADTDTAGESAEPYRSPYCVINTLQGGERFEEGRFSTLREAAKRARELERLPWCARGMIDVHDAADRLVPRELWEAKS